MLLVARPDSYSNGHWPIRPVAHTSRKAIASIAAFVTVA
jgi:hypothetical protein